jgi:glycosyltransferase involved in cell wall biosynthesis
MRICYLNITDNIPPRDAVYIRGLKENGVEIIEIMDSSRLAKKFYNIFKKHHLLAGNYDILWVGYTAHILVPFAWLISRKKIIFNALSSLHEGIIISRRKAGRFSFLALYCWLIDFLAFHLATLSLVESYEQKNYLMRMFYLKENKLLRVWTSADNSKFFYDPKINKLPVFTVLFRGGFLPESGVEITLKTAKLLENNNINFRVIGSGQKNENVFEMEMKKMGLNNMEIIRKKIPCNKLNIIMQECHLSLGQLANHDRLIRTIPHKAFESMSMKIPYLTARNKGVLELLKDNETCFCCNPGDPEDLAKKILELANNYSMAQKVAENAFNLFQKELTPNVLAKQITEAIGN